ncbi:MAG TPA: hypothetical protein VMU67_03475 [Steroidobacteraceae bacterium]|nr:hypothetical protein [Steroidobacteraceae bacterium]
MNTKSKLQLKSLCAVVAIGTLSLTVTATARADEKKPMVTREAAKPLQAAQKDLNAGEYRAALAELQKVEADPKKNAYDTHVVNEFAAFAYVKTGNLAEAAKRFEALIGDGYTPAAEATKRVQNLATIYYQLKDYSKAAQWGERAIKAGGAPSDMYLIVSQSYYVSGDFQAARRFTDSLVGDEIKHGETPKEGLLQIVLNACVKISDQSCIQRSLEHLVTYYPRPEYWQDLVDTLFNSKTAESSDTDLLNIYRLAYAVDAMTRGQQYTEMAQLALEAGSPGEAEQALERGFAKNAFTDQRDRERNERLLASAKKQSAADQASLDELAKSASAAASGEKDAALGLAYLSYGQYDKAVDALQEGLMKGSVKNPAQTTLLLGIAEFKAGKRDQAVRTFRQVSGDPTLVRLANLWSLHARSADSRVANR